MEREKVSWKVVAFVLLAASACAFAGSKVGLHEYTAVSDDVSGEVLRMGQKLVHPGYELQLREAKAPLPILAVQYSGAHYRESPPDARNHAEARAKSIAERMLHAWTLMDHGARIEVAEDDWNAFRSRARGAASGHAAIYVRSPVPGAEPLRILTVYPEDVDGYPWIGSEKSLAAYLGDLIQAHYFLFWRNEGDLSKYRLMRLHKTREGRIFTEVAARANDVAKKKGLRQFDAQIVQEVVAGLPLSQRERLNRLATTPPMDWEATSK